MCLAAILAIVMLWSAIRPHDYFTWFLEVFPVFIALPILVFTYKKFPLSNLVYVLILIHAMIFIVCSICLAISACYEFIEWWVALASGQGADAFLGTQGDVWDTQWDMFLALIGAFTAQISLKNWHNESMRVLKS